jgi:hypothetical protein
MFRPEQFILWQVFWLTSFQNAFPSYSPKFQRRKILRLLPVESDSGRDVLNTMKITAAGTARDFNPVPYYPIFRMEDQNHNRSKYRKEFVHVPIP